MPSFVALVFEGNFHFGDSVRMNWGWPTPNYAGAFIVTLLCGLWSVRGSKMICMLAGMFEVILLAMLCATYSRGSLVALLIAGFVYSYMLRRAMSPGVSVFIVRLVLVVSMLASTGFLGRISPSTMAEDASVGNRFTMWKSGMQMIAASPIKGWGTGESGLYYMNWFQPVSDESETVTLVNSYITVGVERGLPVLFICLFFSLVVCGVTFRSGMSGDFISMAACASAIAWLVCNLFTTLYIDVRLWALPAIFVTLALAGAVLRGDLIGKQLLRTAVTMVIPSALICTFLLFVGIGLRQVMEIDVLPLPGEAVYAQYKVNTTNSETLHVWPDTNVLGERYGRELRRWVGKQKHPITLIVEKPVRGRHVSDAAPNEYVILAGNQCDRLADALALDIHSLWVLHPTRKPPDNSLSSEYSKKGLVVVLPEFDEATINDSWIDWVSRNGGKIRMSAGTGLDISLKQHAGFLRGVFH